LQKVLLGGAWFVLQQQELSPHAQQFGHDPALLGELGSRQCLVDRREALNSASRGGEAFRQPAEKYRLELGLLVLAP